MNTINTAVSHITRFTRIYKIKKNRFLTATALPAISGSLWTHVRHMLFIELVCVWEAVRLAFSRKQKVKVRVPKRKAMEPIHEVPTDLMNADPFKVLEGSLIGAPAPVAPATPRKFAYRSIPSGERVPVAYEEERTIIETPAA